MAQKPTRPNKACRHTIVCITIPQCPVRRARAAGMEQTLFTEGVSLWIGAALLTVGPGGTEETIWMIFIYFLLYSSWPRILLFALCDKHWLCPDLSSVLLSVHVHQLYNAPQRLTYEMMALLLPNHSLTWSVYLNSDSGVQNTAFKTQGQCVSMAIMAWCCVSALVGWSLPLESCHPPCKHTPSTLCFT